MFVSVGFSRSFPTGPRYVKITFWITSCLFNRNLYVIYEPICYIYTSSLLRKKTRIPIWVKYWNSAIFTKEPFHHAIFFTVLETHRLVKSNFWQTSLESKKITKSTALIPGSFSSIKKSELKKQVKGTPVNNWVLVGFSRWLQSNFTIYLISNQ